MSGLPCLPGTMHKCKRCGEMYDRSYRPSSGSVGRDGRRWGASYCRQCHNAYKAAYLGRRMEEKHRCDGCGAMFAPTYQKVNDVKNGRRTREWYCTAACMAKARCVWTDKATKAREKKRRQRERRRARLFPLAPPPAWGRVHAPGGCAYPPTLGIRGRGLACAARPAS